MGSFCFRRYGRLRADERKSNGDLAWGVSIFRESSVGVSSARNICSHGDEWRDLIKCREKRGLRVEPKAGQAIVVRTALRMSTKGNQELPLDIDLDMRTMRIPGARSHLLFIDDSLFRISTLIEKNHADVALVAQWLKDFQMARPLPPASKFLFLFLSFYYSCVSFCFNDLCPRSCERHDMVSFCFVIGSQ